MSSNESPENKTESGDDRFEHDISPFITPSEVALTFEIFLSPLGYPVSESPEQVFDDLGQVSHEVISAMVMPILEMAYLHHLLNHHLIKVP